VAGFLVEEDDSELDLVPGFGFADIGMNPKFDRAAHLSGIMGAVKKMLPRVRIGFSHGRRLPRAVGHMAVVTLDALRGVGAVFPLEMGRLDPGAVRALFVVAGAAELGLAQEFGFHQVVFGRIVALPRTVLGLPRLRDPVEVERSIAGQTGDGVTDVAGDGLVGPAIGGGQGRRDIPGPD
jgi:hypothetical protein